MKIPTKTLAISTGLAVFTMLFGAGDLMYPLTVGLRSGDKFWAGFLGFAITAVLLPLLGFFSMTLFNGNYKTFFYRLGKPLGFIALFICMLIIGPLVAIPRLVTFSYTILTPLLPSHLVYGLGTNYTLIFSIVYLSITFFLAFRKDRIVGILSSIIAPILLCSLAIIIIMGLFSGSMHTVDSSSSTVFISNLIRGYKTLDLFGALFFSSIMLSLLKNTLGIIAHNQPHLVISITLKASLICTAILGIVHFGLGLLGAYHGAGLETLGSGELFRVVAFRIMGEPGATWITIITVLTTCLSTSIALTALVAEYLQSEIFGDKIRFSLALLVTLAASIPLSVTGFSIIALLTSGILMSVGYPTLIALTVCNLAYKLWGFKPVKTPVLVTAIIAFLGYYYL